MYHKNTFEKMEGFSFVTPVTGLTIDLILERKMMMTLKI
jgi:hypothetical protein